MDIARSQYGHSMGYSSNDSHLIGQMMINHWVYLIRQTHFPVASGPTRSQTFCRISLSCWTTTLSTLADDKSKCHPGYLYVKFKGKNVGNQLPFKDPLGDGLVYPFMDDFFWGEKPVDCRIFEIPWDLIFFTATIDPRRRAKITTMLPCWLLIHVAILDSLW